MATVCASSLGGGQLLPAVAGICSPAGLPPARARLERCRERALEPGPHPAGPRHRAWPPGARHRSPALTRPARLGGRGAGQALLSGLAASPVLSVGPRIQPQGGERGHPWAPRHLSRPEHLASSGSRWGPGGPGLGVGGAGPGPGETERAPIFCTLDHTYLFPTLIGGAPPLKINNLLDLCVEARLSSVIFSYV